MKTDGSKDSEKMHFQGQPKGVPEGLVYMRQEVRLDQPKRDRRPFLEDFLQNHVVLSDQKVSGSSKNSCR